MNNIEKSLLGRTGLSVSPIGFGGYRIDARVDGHRQALELALTSGVNLVDTSTNYAEGGSERLVGQVINGLIGAGKLAREDVVVVTKAGYIQGQNYADSQQRKEEGRPWPELVEFGQGLEHCIHPEFLAAQLDASLERLGLAKVDVLLLHNPEYYLGWAVQNGAPLDEAREEFYARVGRAFAYLEGERAAGRIGWYGVSANTLPTPDDDPEHVSLERLGDLAQAISPEHGFGVVEMPFNLLEPGAAVHANQPSGATCLEAAARLGLGVLINRPLNALGQEGLFRLAESGLNGPPPNEQQVNELLMNLMDSEDVLKTSLLPNIHLDPQQQQQLGGYLSIAAALLRSWSEMHGLEHWRQLETQLIARLNAAMGFLAQTMAGSNEGLAALDAHLGRVRPALEAVQHFYAAPADARCRELYQRAAALDAEWAQAPSLSQLAVRAVRSTAGVSCVLVGMRREAYVRDMLAELARPVEPAPREEAWRALAAAGQG